MKINAVLTRILPTLNAVRGSGVFNVAIGRQAPITAEQLRVAANDDRIVVEDLLASLGRLQAAPAFELQQQAIIEITDRCQALLAEIAAGTAPRAQRVRLTARDLVLRISRAATAIQDVFRPDPAVLRGLRTDAAELNALVDAEIAEGARNEKHAQHAARLYDAADALESDDYAERDAAVVEVAKQAKLLVAA